MIPSFKTVNVSKSEEVACPNCNASFKFHRGNDPYIDECGFESYSLKCGSCGSALIGIIDPADDSLLLTVHLSVAPRYDQEGSLRFGAPIYYLPMRNA